jgi:hypothetical protein
MYRHLTFKRQFGVKCQNNIKKYLQELSASAVSKCYIQTLGVAMFFEGIFWQQHKIF